MIVMKVITPNMKRVVGMFLVATLAGITLTGCYGKFALTRKIYQVNGTVQDKYLRSALTWVFIIAPVYEVATLADFIAFNTIEFWSGNNPVAMGEKDYLYAKDGERFDMRVSRQGETANHAIKGEASTVQLKQFGNMTEYVASMQSGDLNH
jgi:uncharacterized protein DUF3332